MKANGARILSVILLLALPNCGDAERQRADSGTDTPIEDTAEVSEATADLPTLETPVDLCGEQPDCLDTETSLNSLWDYDRWDEGHWQ